MNKQTQTDTHPAFRSGFPSSQVNSSTGLTAFASISFFGSVVDRTLARRPTTVGRGEPTEGRGTAESGQRSRCRSNTGLLLGHKRPQTSRGNQ